jgi:hypothetical protein
MVRAIFITSAILILFLSSSAFGARTISPPQPPERKAPNRTVFYARLGTLLPGDVTAGQFKFQTKTEMSYGFGIEFPSRTLVATGVAADIHHIKASNGLMDQNMANFSLLIKRALRPALTGLVVRPGMDLGYGYFSGNYDLNHSASFFTIKFYVELDMVRTKGFGGALELGLIGAPYGRTQGATGVSASAELRPIVRLGLLFH